MHNFTYWGHRVTLPWLDLRSNFDLDLSSSNYTWFDAPWRDKHDSTKTIALPLKWKILSSKNRFGKFWNFDSWWPQFWPDPKKWPECFRNDFSRAFERRFPFCSSMRRSRDRRGVFKHPPPIRWWNIQRPIRARVNARPVGGVHATPHEFFWAEGHTVWRIALKFSIAYGASFAQHLVKKIWSGQVRSRSYDVIRGTTFDKISAKSWVSATWRGAIDLNGDSWWDSCQYMTGFDPWHCARWDSRSTKVTWGHWPWLNSQWQIANRHMFSGVSWGAESESVAHCP